MTTTEKQPSANVWLATIFSFCSFAVLYLIWANQYLPMVDIAQHASILAIWLDYHNPAFGYEDVYRFNWSTPYLLANILAYGFGKLMGVTAGIKMTLSVALLGVPLAFLLLLRQSGGDPWWSLLAFPLVFGYSFYWGFFPFLVAIPIAILHMIVSVRFARRPTIGNAILSAVAGVVLFYAHVIALIPCMVVLIVVYLQRNRDPQTFRRLLIPVLSSLPPFILWVANSEFGSSASLSLRWDLTTGRPFAMIAYLLGNREYLDNIGNVAIMAAIFFLSFRPRIRKDRSAWMPFVTIFIFVLLCPNGFKNALYIYQRLAILIVPAFFYGIAPGNLTPRNTLIARALIVIGVCYALGHLQQRFHQFDREAQSFNQILACMEPHKKLVSLIHADTSHRVAGQSHYRHFPAWYQAEKGGYISFSFAQTVQSFILYQQLHSAKINYFGGLHLHPDKFSWEQCSDFDYYLLRVRYPRDLKEFKREAGDHVKLLCQAKEWYLYLRR